MPVPPSLQSTGYPETLAEIRGVLEKRLTNSTLRLSYTPNFHRGTPDPHALPNEGLSVWLDWEAIDRDNDEPFEATMLQSRWRIYIIAQDEGNDAFGTEAPLAERVWGDIMRSLTETDADIGLDGAIDFLETPTATNFTGKLSGGDRRVQALEVSLVCRHNQELGRC